MRPIVCVCVRAEGYAAAYLVTIGPEMASKRGRNGFHKQVEELGEEVEVWSGDFVLFWKPPSVFGQWTLSSFEVDGAPY